VKVALVTRFGWPAVGGIETLVRTVAAPLSISHDVRVFAHRIDSHDTDWLGPLDRATSFPPQVDPVSGVATIQLRLRPIDLAALAPLLLLFQALPTHRIVRSVISRPFDRLHTPVAGRRFASQIGEADVVHRFGGNRMALATVSAAQRLNCPVVITPLAHPGHWDDDPISARAYRSADLILATSVADAQIYERLGVSPDRLEICPLPSRQPNLGGGPELRRSAGIAGPLILFLGARRANKGVDQLLRAAELIAQRRPEARFAFVGPGAALQARPVNVLDVGEVDERERDAWLDAADLLCLPSSAESFGMVISEAWSAGVPVVTSDLPVLRERMKDSGAGLAVSRDPHHLAEAIAELLGDDALRREMGRAGHAHWKRTLSPDAIARWHASAYNRLAGSHR
jgi:glycosyltransferase involved in cell wall biosynthesis